MRYLLSVSVAGFWCLLFQHAPAQSRTVNDCKAGLVPQFESVKYRAAIDVLNKHLSGILICKTQDSNETRVVFINEMGATFFDFSFFENKYTVNQIMESLDKKAVIRTLAKDLGMILMRSVFKPIAADAKVENDIIVLKLQKKGAVHYAVGAGCNAITRITNMGRRKKVVSIFPSGYVSHSMPDSIFVQHHTVNFTISLKQMHAAE